MKVKCINNNIFIDGHGNIKYDSIIEGKEYELAYPWDLYKTEVKIINENGITCSYLKERFELVEEPILKKEVHTISVFNLKEGEQAIILTTDTKQPDVAKLVFQNASEGGFRFVIPFIKVSFLRLLQKFLNEYFKENK